MTAPEGHLVLVGLMGTGKSTVGRILSERLGRPLLDSDDQVEAATGRTVREIWRADGEDAFRALERDALAAALAREEPAVIAAAGGVVLDRRNRALLRHPSCSVVWLRARSEVLAERVGRGGHRPLLDDDPAARLEQMQWDRDTLYAEVADVVVDVEVPGPEGVADAICRLVGPRTERVTVELAERSYEVVVGSGALAALGSVLPDGAARAAVVTQAGIGVAVDPGIEHRTFHVGEGEETKSMGTVEQLCRQWSSWGLTRSDVVVAVGGGVVTDTAGFAAACYHRGTAVVHVPTTLLGMIDAAIGGKTGVNLPEGKNLVGAFWQPGGVICDTDTLAGLPEREWASGLGEQAKYHFLTGEDLEALDPVGRIAACVRIKAEVVASDEREGGRRAILNYGHTLAHALETSGGYDLRHGEAVGIGLVYAAELARALGRIDASRVADHRRVVGGYRLPTELPEGSDADELVEIMARDKKAVHGLTLALDGPDGVEVVAGIDPDLARDTLEELR